MSAIDDALLHAFPPPALDRTRVAGPERDGNLLAFTVTSPFQQGETAVEVLLPDDRPDGAGCPVLYLLPVTPGKRGLLRQPAELPPARRAGNGILEARAREIANRHGVACVAPSFHGWPWIADHPDDPRRALESHLLRVVVPLVEARFAVRAGPANRLLLGFSKSGVAAFSLLLRYPDHFACAASWDAPMTLPAPDRWNMDESYGTPEHYRRHFIPELLARQAPLLRGGPARLLLAGSCLFPDHTAAVHRQMTALAIPHDYRDVPLPEHLWSAGWFPDAVARLLALHRRLPPGCPGEGGLARPAFPDYDRNQEDLS